MPGCLTESRMLALIRGPIPTYLNHVREECHLHTRAVSQRFTAPHRPRTPRSLLLAARLGWCQRARDSSDRRRTDGQTSLHLRVALSDEREGKTTSDERQPQWPDRRIIRSSERSTKNRSMSGHITLLGSAVSKK